MQGRSIVVFAIIAKLHYISSCHVCTSFCKYILYQLFLYLFLRFSYMK